MKSQNPYFTTTLDESIIAYGL
eukprot:Gb_22394 [translate_table: standard]